jgi:hypothetical protein
MFEYKFKIAAVSQGEADNKANALAKLASEFDAKTLTALATKGKAFLNSPVYGGIIRSNLGL